MNTYTIALRSGKIETVKGDTAKEVTKNGADWLVISDDNGGIAAKYAMDTVANYRKEQE